jgi:hypothetical protein
VNEHSCYVEDDECPNPREEQNQREGEKYKPHEQIPLWPAIISLFDISGLGVKNWEQEMARMIVWA